MRARLIVNDTALDNIELAVFDKDGTLIDVHTYWSNMIRLRAELARERLQLDAPIMHGLMESMGVDVARMRIKPEGPVGLRKREVVLQAGVDYLVAAGFGDAGDALQDAFSDADRKSLDHLTEIIRPIDGLHTLFDGLRAAHCRIAIATTDRTHRARLAMEQLGIADQIDCIAGADRVARPKPAPDIIYLMAQSFGVRARSIVMIGDSVADVQTGLNAGCGGSIGVASGLTDPGRLREVTPYVVGSIADITAQAA